jgi:hypothetical protein
MKKFLSIMLLIMNLFIDIQVMAANQAPRQQPQKSAATWACPVCTLINDAKAPKCTICETQRPAVASGEKRSKVEEARSRESTSATAWQCSVCTFENRAGHAACEMCEAKRPVEPGAVKKQKTKDKRDKDNNDDDKKHAREVVDVEAEDEVAKVVVKKEPVSVSNNERWKCPGCDYENASTVAVCPMCQAKKPEAITVVTTASVQKAEKAARDVVCVNDDSEAAAFTVLSNMITASLGFSVDFRTLVSDAIRLVGLVPGECYLLRKPASYETGCGSAAPYNEKNSFAITIQPDRLYAEYFASRQSWSFGVLRMMLLHEASHIYQYKELHQDVFEVIKQISREEIVFERAADDMAAAKCGCWQCIRDWADYLGRMSPKDKQRPIDGKTAAFPGGLSDKRFYSVFGATSLDDADQIVTQESKQAMVAYIVASYEQVSNTVSLVTGRAHPHNAERAVRSLIASARFRKSHPEALCAYHKQQQAQAMAQRLRTSAAATLAALSTSSVTAATSSSLAAIYKGGSLGSSLPAVAQLVPMDRIVVVPSNQKSDQKEEHKEAHRSRNKRRFGGNEDARATTNVDEDEALVALGGESIGSIGLLPSMLEHNEDPLECSICHQMISQGQKILKGCLGDLKVPHALHADCKKEHTVCPCCKQPLSLLEESVAL